MVFGELVSCPPSYDDFSSAEEEIQVNETRDTVVTVGKKRTAAKKMPGRPPSKRRN